MKTKSATPIMSALPSPTNWQNVNWRKAERYVEKLQQRIFRAEKMNLPSNAKIKAWQKWYLKSIG